MKTACRFPFPPTGRSLEILERSVACGIQNNAGVANTLFEHQRILRMQRNSVNARAGGIPGPEPDAGMAAVLLLRV